MFTSKRFIISIMCASLLFAWTTQGQTQTVNPPGATATGKIVKTGSPFDDVEQNVGNAVEALCPSLVARTSAGTNNAAQVDLQVRCTEMVLAQDNNLSGTNTANVLRAATAEEVATQGTQLVELSALTGTTTAITRLNELRTASSGKLGFAFNEKSGVATFNQDIGGSAGDDTFGAWSFYINGALSTGDRDETANESGFDFDGGGVILGADYRQGDNTFIGVNVSLGTADADLANGSKVESDGVGITAYGTTYLQNEVYIEGTLGFASHDYDLLRKISYDVPTAAGTGVTSVRQDAISSTDGNEVTASIGAGKDITKGANTISVSGHLTYLDADIDGYSETINSAAPGFGLALEVDSQTIESLRSVLGLQFSRTISTTTGVVVPFVRADWVHEFKNDPRQTRARFVNDPFTTGGFVLADGTPATSTFALTTDGADEDYFRLGGGISGVWAGGWQGFLALDTLLGLKNINAYALTLGVRKDI